MSTYEITYKNYAGKNQKVDVNTDFGEVSAGKFAITSIDDLDEIVKISEVEYID